MPPPRSEIRMIKSTSLLAMVMIIGGRFDGSLCVSIVNLENKKKINKQQLKQLVFKQKVKKEKVDQ